MNRNDVWLFNFIIAFSLSVRKIFFYKEVDNCDLHIKLRVSTRRYVLLYSI